ncbi:MAG: 4-hydroxy-3-methylbut-2-enyl diphosphate reductase [Candidatus Zixiibacteriota bacterium]|nr:MAG: 4-hydroxy-3-methylbut-2-enyl diphosphate reductase [candidate division Zixibacteria bacterium]
MIKKIIIARSKGFCMGVKRAINIAEDTARKATGPVTILNQIVHNEAVVESFRNMGVGQKWSVDEVEGGTLIIPAHGASPDVMAVARAKGLNIIDATCPLVTRICTRIMEVIPRGYYIIHFGDRDHDETKGILGHAPDRITVISNMAELDNYPDWPDRRLGLTVQSTMGIDDFQQFQAAAKKKWPQIETFDTICNATTERQKAIFDMAPGVDMILVVGSETSANSKRMADISKAQCGRSELIGSAVDISEGWFVGDGAGIETVGVTAGASTPDFLVEAVIDTLLALSNGAAEVILQEDLAVLDETAEDTEK